MKAETKEYILGLITTLKLTEKDIRSLEEEAAKWKHRADLARSRGMEELCREAEKETERIIQKLTTLQEEAKELRNQINEEARKLPVLAAGERSIDTDLLEQELLMLLGKTQEEAETDRAFRELEKNSAAESALEALKAKMKAPGEDKP